MRSPDEAIANNAANHNPEPGFQCDNCLHWFPESQIVSVEIVSGVSAWLCTDCSKDEGEEE